MVTIDLERSIITGEQKRALECYIDSRHFRQRKSYDEYYIDVDYVQADLSINDLMILAEDFTVTITSNSVAITND